MGRRVIKEGKEQAKILLWIVLLLCSFSVEAVSRIKNIRYEGNLVTQDSVLNRELYIRKGDELNEALLNKSKQGIMNLGLFKTVNVYIDNVSDQTEAWVDIVFVVEEKYYLLIIPRARSNDNEFDLGVQLRWDNVWGLNHEMRLLFEDRGETQGISENRNNFRYAYPNLFGGSYSVNLNLQRVNEVDESDGVVDRQDDIYELSLSKWLNERGRSRGAFISASLGYQQRYSEVIVGEDLSESVNANILGLGVGYSKINNYAFNRGGKAYGYVLDLSHEDIGSEDEFTRQLLYYRSYYQIKGAPLSNLNVQTKLGHSNSDILGDDAFSLGSSDDLRGYENNRFNGNSMFLMNIEYMFPQPDYPVIRYVYFIDMGSTTDEFKELFHQPVNIGAGIGIRWKVRSLVNIDLRTDVAYGFTDEDYRFSFGTRHAF